MPCGHNGMCGTPRFLTTFGNAVSIRQVIKLLKCIINFHVFCRTVVNQLSEVFFVFAFNHKNGLLESRHKCIIKRKIQDYLPFIAYRFYLLQPSKAAAHTGCHYNQNRFFFHMLPPALDPAYIV